MGLGTKILKYVKTCIKKNILTKSIAVLVTTAFILNIINLPVFGANPEGYELKKTKNEKTEEGILSEKDETKPVVRQQGLQFEISIDADNKIHQTNAENNPIIGYWDNQVQEAYILNEISGEFEANQEYTKAVKTILSGRQSQAANTARLQQRAQPLASTAMQANAKTPDVRQVNQTDEIKGSQQKKEQSEVKTPVSIRPKADNKQSEPQTSLLASKKDDTESYQKDVYTQDEEKEIKDLMRKTGLSESEIKTIFHELRKETQLSLEEIINKMESISSITQQRGVLAALNSLFIRAKSIVFCAADAITTILNLNEIEKSVLAFQLIIADAIGGLFVQNNQGLIDNTSGQLAISALSVQKELRDKYGQNYNGYSVSISDIMKGLKSGSSAIVYVNGNHFITITRNKGDGTYTIFDPNKAVQNGLTIGDVGKIEKAYNLKSGQKTIALAQDFKDRARESVDLMKTTGSDIDDITFPENTPKDQKKLYEDLKEAYQNKDFNKIRELIENFSIHGIRGFEALINRDFSEIVAGKIYMLLGSDAYSILQTIMVNQNADVKTIHEQSLEFAQEYELFLRSKVISGLKKVQSNDQAYIDMTTQDIANLKDKLVNEEKALTGLADNVKSFLRHWVEDGSWCAGKNGKIDWEKWAKKGVKKGDYDALVKTAGEEGQLKKLVEDTYNSAPKSTRDWYKFAKLFWGHKWKESSATADAAKYDQQIKIVKQQMEQERAEDEKNIDNAKANMQKALTATDQAAKEIAIVDETVNLLINHAGSRISGQLGQVLTNQKVNITQDSLGLNGTYYRLLTVYADWSGKEETIHKQGLSDTGKPLRNSDGSVYTEDITIPQYAVSVKDSISTQEGGEVTATRQDKDGNKYTYMYKVFGITGIYADSKYGAQIVIWDYMYDEENGVAKLTGTANVYLTNDNEKIYQEKTKEQKSRSPQSGSYEPGAAAPARSNWTSGVITEDQNGYMISGAGSRITVKLAADGITWKTDILGYGTEALEGSTLKISSDNLSKNAPSVYINIKHGSMIYAGSFWSATGGCIYGFDADKNTQNQVDNYIENVIKIYLLSGNNADKVGKVTMNGSFDYKTIEMYGNPSSVKDILRSTGCSVNVDVKEGFVYESSQQGDIYNARINSNTTLKLSGENVENEGYIISLYATKDVSVTYTLPEGWKFSDGNDSDLAIMSKGDEISLSRMLANRNLTEDISNQESFLADFLNKYSNYGIIDLSSIWGKYGLDAKDKNYFALITNIINKGDYGVLQKFLNAYSKSEYFYKAELDKLKIVIGTIKSDKDKLKGSDNQSQGLYIVNTAAIEIDLGQKEVVGYDSSGKAKYGKTKAEKIPAGVLKLKSNGFGQYSLVNNLYMHYKNGNFSIDGNQSKTGLTDDNSAYFGAGSSVSLLGIKDAKGNITYSAVVTGTLYVRNLTVIVPPPSGDSSADENYKPLIDPVDSSFHGNTSGANYNNGKDNKNGTTYKATGYFTHISSAGLSGESLGNVLFAPGSAFSKHSYIAPDQKAKYSFTIDGGGNIEFNRTASQAALDAFVSFCLSLVSVMVSVVALLITITPSPVTALLMYITGGVMGAVGKLGKLGTAIASGVKKWAVYVNSFTSGIDVDSNSEEASKITGQMIVAGIVSFITFAAAVASAVSTIVDGPAGMSGAVASLTAGIGFVGGVMSAKVVFGLVASTVSLFQQAAQAKTAEEREKLIAQGIENLFFSAVIIGLSFVGGVSTGGIASNITGQVVKRALIGGAIGLGIGVAVPVIANFIKDGTHWNAQDLENLIEGAITGLLGGINIGAKAVAVVDSVSASAAKEVGEETVAETTKEAAVETEKIANEEILQTVKEGTNISWYKTFSIAFLGNSRNIIYRIGTGLFNFSKTGLNTFIMFTMSRSLIKGIKEKDIDSILGSLNGLVSFGIVSPFMEVSNIDKVEMQGLVNPFKDIGATFKEKLSDAGDYFKSVWKDAVKPMFGFSEEGFVTGNLIKTLASVGIGAVLGGVLISAIGGENSHWWEGVLVGVGIGFGFGSVLASGEYSGASLASKLNAVKENLNTVNLTVNSFKMIEQMSIFNTQMIYSIGILDHTGLGKKIENNGFFKFLFNGLDNIMGQDFLSKGKALSENQFGYSEKTGNIEFIDENGQKQTRGYKLSDLLSENLEPLLDPSQIVTFSAMAGIANPMLKRVFERIPILGQLQERLNAFSESDFMRDSLVLKNIYDSIIKDALIANIRNLTFGDSQAGFIFQGIFGATNIKGEEKLDYEKEKSLASWGVNIRETEGVIRDIARAENIGQLTAGLNKLKNMGLVSETDNLEQQIIKYDIKASEKGEIAEGVALPGMNLERNKVREAVIKEIVYNKIAQAGSFTEASLGKVESDMKRSVIDEISLLDKRPLAEQINFLYASAVIKGLGIEAGKEGISKEQIDLTLKMTKDKGFGILANYATGLDEKSETLKNIADSMLSYSQSTQDSISGAQEAVNIISLFVKKTNLNSALLGQLNKISEIEQNKADAAYREKLKISADMSNYEINRMRDLQKKKGKLSSDDANELNMLNSKYLQVDIDFLRHLDALVKNPDLSAKDIVLILETTGMEYIQQTDAITRTRLNQYRQQLAELLQQRAVSVSRVLYNLFKTEVIDSELTGGLDALLKKTMSGFVRSFITGKIDIVGSGSTIAAAGDIINNVQDRMNAINNVRIKISDGRELVLDSRNIVITGISGKLSSLRFTIKVNGIEYKDAVITGDINLATLNNRISKQLLSFVEENIVQLTAAENVENIHFKETQEERASQINILKTDLEKIVSDKEAFNSDSRLTDGAKEKIRESAEKSKIKSISAESIIETIENSVFNKDRLKGIIQKFSADSGALVGLSSLDVNKQMSSPLYGSLASEEFRAPDGTMIYMSDFDFYVLLENFAKAAKILPSNSAEKLSSITGEMKIAEKEVKEGRMSQEDADLKFKDYIEDTGYTLDSLLPRLERLKDKAGEKSKNIYLKFYDAGGINLLVNKFIETNSSNRAGVNVFNGDILDKLRDYVNGMENKTQSVSVLRTFMYEAVKRSKIFGGLGIRAAQSEMTTALQNDFNASVGMGGGKTISTAIDIAVSRVLLGEAACLEVLVGNSDLANYAGEGSEARNFLEFLGMKVVSADQLKSKNGEYDAEKLANAYSDPNTVVVMDPTTRGHLKNMSSGYEGQIIRMALNSVNRVVADEVHLWALTRTAAIVGEGNKPPSREIIGKAMKIAEVINAEEIVKHLESDSASDMQIEIKGMKVDIKRFSNLDTAAAALADADGTKCIAIIGEMSGELEVRMTSDIKGALLEDAGYSAGELNSVIRGLFSAGDNSGLAISKQDGKVKPVGAQGVEENMVVSDIYRQLGFALREGLRAGKSSVPLSEYIANATQVSNTSMQTSLAAIYEGSHAKIVGISGTVTGLQQLLINRTGADKVYNITGEKATADMFSEAIDIDEPSALSGIIKKAVGRAPDKENAQKMLNNILFLAKTQGSIARVRQAVKDNWSLLQEKGIEIYEFTNAQGKWKNQAGEIEPLEQGKTISDIAQDKGKNRLIIANEIGATGINYQGDFTNVILDSHLMSNTDLAQALKRTGRPNGKAVAGEPQRWAISRIIAYSKARLIEEVKAFYNNLELKECARELWKGTSPAGDYMKDTEAFGNVNYFDNDKIKVMAEADIKKLLIYISKIRGLYDIDGAVRFSINDSIRDKMVLSPLRKLIGVLKGSQLTAVQKELKDALKISGYFSDDNFDFKEMSSELGKDVMRKSFINSSDEAKEIFGRLKYVLKGKALDLIDNHLKLITSAMDENSYENNPVITTKGLSSAIDIAEFVQIMRSFESYIMPIGTVVDLQGNVAVDDFVKVSESAGMEQKAIAQEYRKIVSNANNKNDELSRENGKGQRVLTGKGRLLAELAQYHIDNDASFMLFIKWYSRSLKQDKKEKINVGDVRKTVDDMWEAGLRDTVALREVQVGFKMLSGQKQGRSEVSPITLVQLQSIYNARHSRELEAAAQITKLSLPSARQIAIAKVFKSDKDNASARLFNNIAKQSEQLESSIKGITKWRNVLSGTITPSPFIRFFKSIPFSFPNWLPFTAKKAFRNAVDRLDEALGISVEQALTDFGENMDNVIHFINPKTTDKEIEALHKVIDIAPKGVFEKIKVSDADKFVKLKMFVQLLKDGVISAKDPDILKNLNAGMLNKVLDGRESEKAVILGQTNWKKIRELLNKSKGNCSVEEINDLFEDFKIRRENKEQRLKVMAMILEYTNADYKKVLERLENVSAELESVKLEDIKLSDLINDDLFYGNNNPNIKFMNTVYNGILKGIDRVMNVEGAGEKLLGKMGTGFTKPEELKSAVVKALVLFANKSSMERYLGLTAGTKYGKSEIVDGAYEAYKKVMGFYGDKKISLEQAQQYSEVTRVVADILMAVQDKSKWERAELVRLVNKSKLDDLDIEKIQKMIELSVKANNNTFVKVLRTAIVKTKRGEQIFTVNAGKLKKALETPVKAKGSLLSEKVTDLMPILEIGDRGNKKHLTELIELSNIRAVAQAA